MQRRITTWLAATLAAVALLGATTGCNEWLVGTHAASFGAGWLLRDVTMPATTETVCYQNGELVDCSEIPLAQTGE
jgi:hypothetical protein